MTGLADIMLPKFLQETSWPVGIGCLAWGAVSGVFGARFRRCFLAIWAGLVGAAVGGYVGGAFGEAGATVGASVATGLFTVVAIVLEFPMVFLLLALIGGGSVFLFAGADTPVNWVLAGLVAFSTGLLGVQARSKAYAPLFSIYSAMFLVIGAGAFLGYDTLADLHAALQADKPYEAFFNTQWRQLLAVGGLTIVLWFIQSSVEGFRERDRRRNSSGEDVDSSVNPLLVGSVATPPGAVVVDGAPASRRPAAAPREIKPAKPYPHIRFIIVAIVLAVVALGAWQEIDCRRSLVQAIRLDENGQGDESRQLLAATVLRDPLSYSAHKAQERLLAEGGAEVAETDDPLRMLGLYWAPVIYLGMAVVVWFLAAVFHGHRSALGILCAILMLAGAGLVVARLCRWGVLSWPVPKAWTDPLALSPGMEFIVAISSLALALAMLCWPRAKKPENHPRKPHTDFLLGPGFTPGSNDSA